MKRRGRKEDNFRRENNKERRYETGAGKGDREEPLTKKENNTRPFKARSPELSKKIR